MEKIKLTLKKNSQNPHKSKNFNKTIQLCHFITILSFISLILPLLLFLLLVSTLLSVALQDTNPNK